MQPLHQMLGYHDFGKSVLSIDVQQVDWSCHMAVGC